MKNKANKQGAGSLYKRNLKYLLKIVQDHPDLSFIKELQSRFPKAEIYLVGGAVRDGALGIKEHKDYDFVIRNLAPQTLEAFLKTIGTVNLVGKNFGVLKFLPSSSLQSLPSLKSFPLEPIDIALPRTEKSLSGSGAYRDFEVQSDPFMSIEEDLSRRDFTMNAMAIKILPPPSPPFKGGDKGEVYLIDPFNGLKDLADKIIRAVGKPEERFHEDYTRLLRAVRFACQLNFLIEEKTWDVLKALSPRLNDTLPNSEEYIVSRETIGKELVQAFFYNPTRAFDLFDASGLMGALMPELLAMKNCPQPKEYHTEGDVWVHTRLALSALRSAAFKKEFRDNPKVDANLIVATLFHDLGKPLTIKTPERDKTDRIRFDGHDEQGARTARHLCNSLKLSQFPKSSPLHIGSEHLGWLIDNHLLLVTGKIEEMRPSTIEKYFFKDKALGDNLLKLAFADGLASILPKGEPALSLFYKMRKRIKELGKLDKKTNGLPPPLLSGGEIMELLNIPPSPQVGEIIAKLREAQLEGKIRTKREAISLLSQIKVKK